MMAVLNLSGLRLVVWFDAPARMCVFFVCLLCVCVGAQKCWLFRVLRVFECVENCWKARGEFGGRHVKQGKNEIEIDS